MSEFDKMISDPEAARKDSRFAAQQMDRSSKFEKRMLRKKQYDSELWTMWQSHYMQKLLKDFTQLRDDAAEKANDPAGVARWRALHDVVGRLENDRRKAGEQTT